MRQVDETIDVDNNDNGDDGKAKLYKTGKLSGMPTNLYKSIHRDIPCLSLG